MNRWIRTAAWLSFIAAMYLILVEAVWPWIHLPGLGNIGFTLVLVSFALIHCVAVEGGRRTVQFFAISAAVSYLMEEIGVRTGLIYGAYHYSDMLGTKLGHVPVIIPLAWFMMIYPSWMVAKSALRGVHLGTVAGVIALALIAAGVKTAWDLVMDPGMASAGNWIWEHGGEYFGVPLRNYLGWLLTTFLVYWLTGLFWKREGIRPVTTTFEALPVILYAFFAIRYLSPTDVPALQLVALFAMGMPSLIALFQLFISARRA